MTGKKMRLVDSMMMLTLLLTGCVGHHNVPASALKSMYVIEDTYPIEQTLRDQCKYVGKVEGRAADSSGGGGFIGGMVQKLQDKWARRDAISGAYLKGATHVAWVERPVADGWSQYAVARAFRCPVGIELGVRYKPPIRKQTTGSVRTGKRSE